MGDFVREMLISHDDLETRVAILEDRKLVEFYVERPKRSVVGNVYLGKVTDVLPGMQAAFVDVGLEKNAFLYVDDVIVSEELESGRRRDIQQLLRVGQQILVQVTKDAMGTKGPRITTEITLPGRFLVLMPFSRFTGVSKKLPDDERDRLHDIVAPMVPEGVGVIIRTAASGVTPRDLTSDLEFLLRLWKRVLHQANEALAPEIVYSEMDLALRIVRDVFSDEFKAMYIDHRGTHDKIVSFLKKSSPGLVRRIHHHRDRTSLFSAFRIEPSIENALRRSVGLPSGGHIVIDRTEAMTVVDVNTGHYVGKRSLEDTILRTNLEAADEIAAQLRLRDIGGIVVIDFIDMEVQGNRDLVLGRLGEALQRDRTKTRLGEMSRLGLVELTRKNVSDGIYDSLTERCPRCEGDGRILSPTSRMIAVERRIRELVREGKSEAYLLGVREATYRLLTAPGVNLVASLRAETGRHVTLVPDESVGPTEVCVLIEGRRGDVSGR